MSNPDSDFRYAFATWSEAIFRHCYYRLGDREQALDLTQEAFTRTWAYMTEKGGVKNVRAFLYRVANNLIIDHRRKSPIASLDEMSERGHETVDPKAFISAEAIDAKNSMALLQQLNPAEQDLIIMRYIDGLKPREMARFLGLSVNVVSVRLHRATKRFQHIIDQATAS
ncbi:MAG: sigma-70 family RNA polymerase sigma factor [Candidatus Kerfeldbacteria bacterium]|nr:sigma-70 family RNA polymerase sigma factor [Candidatus Kerfeldbacteria bacterium]